MSSLAARREASRGRQLQKLQMPVPLRRSLSGGTTPGCPSSPNGSPSRTYRQLWLTGASTPAGSTARASPLSPCSPGPSQPASSATTPRLVSVTVVSSPSSLQQRQPQVIRATPCGPASTSASATPLATVRAHAASAPSSAVTPPANRRNPWAAPVFRSRASLPSRCFTREDPACPASWMPSRTTPASYAKSPTASTRSTLAASTCGQEEEVYDWTPKTRSTDLLVDAVTPTATVITAGFPQPRVGGEQPALTTPVWANAVPVTSAVPSSVSHVTTLTREASLSPSISIAATPSGGATPAPPAYDSRAAGPLATTYGARPLFFPLSEASLPAGPPLPGLNGVVGGADPNSEEERKSLRMALRRYKAHLQEQIMTAEEVIQEINPWNWSCSTPSVGSSFAFTSVPAKARMARSLSPEAHCSAWPSIAATVVPKAASVVAPGGSAVGTPPTAAWTLPARMMSSLSAGKLVARRALEAALESSAPLQSAPTKVRSPDTGSAPEELKPSSRQLPPRPPEGVRQRHRSQEPAPRVPDEEGDGAGLNFSPQSQRRPLSCCTSRAVSRSATPEPPPSRQPRSAPVSGTWSSRLRAALRAARNAGLDDSDSMVARAEALLRSEDLIKSAVRADIKKALADFEDARLVGDLRRLREIKELLGQIVDSRAEAAGLPEAELREAERHRRKVHNAIEDVKGHVRVFCRLRPLSDRELEQGDAEAVRVVDSMRLEVPRCGVFTFDSVFAPGSQEDVFEDCRDLVQSAVDGHNVTIFAYGQTGAGKTYTLYGSAGEEGIAGRAISELFEVVERLRPKHSVQVTASMFELHRNRLVDLLRLPQRRNAGNSPPSSPKLSLRSCSEGGVQVDRLIERDVKDAPELKRLLARGLSGRTVAANAVNAESSRSHLLFTIKVSSTDLQTQEVLSGKILLCDLGGSERLKKTEATGEQLKEAIEINRSLTALGDVIEAVAERRRQIPYRNHKLTQLLQDSLGGTSKTLMFVNCSPAESNLQETTMSLGYAVRAKRIANTTAMSPVLRARRGLRPGASSRASSRAASPVAGYR
eukprot:TRINITY_DN4344_c0_g1_i1.p1 TRINITY_DN4344_c0_g1~~TRINITY_DN4344_c0_g1_i1.p1  ORF type:complete len:1050 (+),score=173.82 TRINITY_DN4344_c0_g1_i1:75-3224(+)